MPVERMSADLSPRVGGVPHTTAQWLSVGHQLNAAAAAAAIAAVADSFTYMTQLCSCKRR